MAEADQSFASFTEWKNKAPSWLTRHPDFHPTTFRAICFDAKGRLCVMGRDFMAAEHEGAFPVRWVWPDQIPDLYRRAFQAEAPE